MQTGRRQSLPRLFGDKGIAAIGIFDQRLVQMPTTGKQVGQSRPAHKRGVVTVAATDLLDRTAKQDRGIRSTQSVLGMEREFDLAGTEF